MDHLTLLLQQYGYVLLFGVGFLEFAGAPIASVPVLVIAGALASVGDASLGSIIVSAALGGLLGDLVWYSLARWRGRGLVDTVCGLSSNPMACVLSVERRVEAVGPGFLLPAKFMPGAGNLVAAASGFAGMKLKTFLMLDLIALLIWAGVYSTLGWLFAPQLDPIVRWATAFPLWIIGLAAALIVGAGAWRLAKIRMHRERHAAMRAAAGGLEG